MSDLSKRTYKYYIKSSFKILGFELLLELILIIEWLLMGTDESLIEYISRMFIMCGGLIGVLTNGIYAMYGPSLYDGLVLSMGGRRKEIFWGQIIKQIIYVGGNSLVLLIVATFVHRPIFYYYILGTAVVGFLFGAAGLVIGHKVKKHGKMIIFIIIICCAGIGGGIGGAAAMDSNQALLNMISGVPAIAYLPIAGLIYVALEVWVYKLNKSMMVR